MNPDLQKELFSRLDAFASKLGVAASHLWGVLTKQAYLEGISDFIWCGICLFIFGMLIWYTKRLYAFHQREEKIDTSYAGSWLCGTFLMFIPDTIALSTGIQFLTSAIRHICNPEFYALQLLIDTVKQ